MRADVRVDRGDRSHHSDAYAALKPRMAARRDTRALRLASESLVDECSRERTREPEFEAQP